jgi:adenosylhomocysteine nucleosidase
MAMDPGAHPVALIVALDEEARGVARHLAPSAVSSPHLAIWTGDIEDAPVVLVVSGVGKVAAALAMQFVCDVYQPRCAITFGLAGATESDSQTGRLIVASGAVQHDMDGRPLTEARGVIPSLGKAIFAADEKLSKSLRHATEQIAADPEAVAYGLVLTGDQIVTSRAVRDALLREFPQGLCFDMETAAVAQAAEQNGIPWAALRMTSDSADESFNLDHVISFGIDTAADLFDQIISAFLVGQPAFDNPGRL